jgi:hypothetical protein
MHGSSYIALFDNSLSGDGFMWREVEGNGDQDWRIGKGVDEGGCFAFSRHYFSHSHAETIGNALKRQKVKLLLSTP